MSRLENPPSLGRAALVGLVLVCAAVFPRAARGQMRRDPAVRHASAVRHGDLLLGAGVALGLDGTFPLSGLSGDLLSAPRLSLAYGLADGVVIEIRGDALQVLSIEGRGPGFVALSEDADDGTTRDSGDFRIGTLFTLFGGAEGLSGGFRVEVKLPNSNERKGIGPNTTDFRLGVLGSWARGPWRLTGDVGVGILEAPLENFEQNDVLVYSAELLVRVPGSPLRLYAGADGRTSTRGRVPIGTGDLGQASLGADLRLGAWVLDGGLTFGYAGSTPDWGLSAGVSRRIAGS